MGASCWPFSPCPLPILRFCGVGSGPTKPAVRWFPWCWTAATINPANRSWKNFTVPFIPCSKGTPFLESCFWEKIAENEYGDRNYAGQIDALNQAVEKGWPTAHLYNDLGALFLRRSRLPEARESFEKALRCSPDYTSAAAGLQALEQTEKTGALPRD